jgi:hypothetical protein
MVVVLDVREPLSPQAAAICGRERGGARQITTKFVSVQITGHLHYIGGIPNLVAVPKKL